MIERLLRLVKAIILSAELYIQNFIRQLQILVFLQTYVPVGSQAYHTLRGR